MKIKSLIIITALIAQAGQASPQLSLVESARQNDADTVTALLKEGADINTTRNDGTSALHWAAHWDNLELAKNLLRNKANPNLANAYGVTPLYLACTNKSTEMVELLLNAGADPNTKLWSGETPFMNCARVGAAGAIMAMVTAGADVNSAETEKGQTALMWAAAGGHGEVVRVLLENGADVKAQSKNRFTPLLFSARAGDVETAKYLIEAGADPNESTEEQGNTLVLASASGHEALSVYLLEQGANPDSADEYGVTALHNSIRNGMSTVNGVRYDAVYRVRPENMHGLTRSLLEAGADPNVQIQKSHRLGPDGSAFEMTYATPMMLAALSSDVELMNLLAEFEADPGISAKGGITPLIAAAQAACTGSCAFQGGNQSNADNLLALEAVKAAVEMGVDVNARTEKGQTAMHMAAFIGADEIVQYLYDQGAKVNVSDNYGETPWSMASGISPVIRYQGLYGNHESTAALLLKLGAKVVSRDQMDDRSPPPPGQ
jgi:ankyrin repeat protein